MKQEIKKLIKLAARPVMNSIFEFLMRGARKHKGRRLFGVPELKLVREALLSQNLFGMDGYMVSSFEKEFAQSYGVPYAVASTSGTAAIHTALGALDLNAGDEVITAPITDLGTIIPILYQNCIPVFADVDDTYQMDAEDIERKIAPRTKAIIVVHLFGNACNMDRIVAVAKKHGIPLIEDCSQAHMTEYKGRYVGTIGDIGCFSFQQSKHMTTGDGGMTITSNKAYYDRMKLFVDKGYARKGWGTRAYLFHAPNYRMNELTAAVGRVQLKKVKAVVDQRHAMGLEMSKRLSGIEGIRPTPVTDGANHSYWLYSFKLEGVNLESFCKEMIRQKVYAMAGYTGKAIYLCTESLTTKKTYGNSEVPFSLRRDRNFEYKEGLCPKAEKALEVLVCIPWNESWGIEGVEKAAQVVKESLEKVSGKAPAQLPLAPSLRKVVGAEPTDSKKESGGVQTLRVAIIGCGQIGRWHLDAYQKNSDVKIAAVVDTELDRAEKFAREIGAKAYRSHQEMIRSEKLDGASVCTVPATHEAITCDLLDAGIHVLCEKPLSISSVSAEKMLKKASEKNKLLLTAFKLRFSEEVRHAKALIEKGALGRILTFRLIFGGYMEMAGTWFVKKEISGGGVVMDNGPHAVDLIHYLLGPVDNILARGVDTTQVGVEDTAKIDVTLKSGATGTAHLSWASWVTPASYLEIYGDEGTLLLDPAGATYKFKTWTDWKRISNKGDAHAGFSNQIDHFVRAIKNQGQTSVLDAKAGLEVQRILEAIYESIQKDSTVIL